MRQEDTESSNDRYTAEFGSQNKNVNILFKLNDNSNNEKGSAGEPSDTNSQFSRVYQNNNRSDRVNIDDENLTLSERLRLEGRSENSSMIHY